MMASIPAYNTYAREVLMPKMDQTTLTEILALETKKAFDNPRYEELLITSYYKDHILRLPPDQWPEPVTRSFGKLNRQIYVMMQGPSEMGSSGTLENWSRASDLSQIVVPTLVIGATHDTMDPGHMQMIAQTVGKGRFLLCQNGSHMAMYDDQETYFAGLTTFLRDVDTGAF
jgi:proline iminopeptidase